MICVRCDQAIRPGEPYDTHLHHGATLGGCTNHTHRTCRPAPHRTGTRENTNLRPTSPRHNPPEPETQS